MIISGLIIDRAVGTYRVPDLQFDLLAIDCDHSSAELDANSKIMDWLETFVGELQEQA